MSWYRFEKNNQNPEVRKAIIDSHLRHYEVADRIGINPCTLSMWLSRPLSEDKKEAILSALKLER